MFARPRQYLCWRGTTQLTQHALSPPDANDSQLRSNQPSKHIRTPPLDCALYNVAQLQYLIGCAISRYCPCYTRATFIRSSAFAIIASAINKLSNSLFRNSKKSLRERVSHARKFFHRSSIRALAHIPKSSSRVSRHNLSITAARETYIGTVRHQNYTLSIFQRSPQVPVRGKKLTASRVLTAA